MDIVRDFVKENKAFYVPKNEPVIINVPKMKFLMVDGKGAPDPEVGKGEHVSEFQDAMGALYGVVYSIKMSYKGSKPLTGYENFKVPPPEALWWMTDGSVFDMKKPNDWRWTLMIRVPEFVTKKMVSDYINMLVIKKKSEIYKKVRLEQYEEGTCVQLLHIGAYGDEGPNILKMHAFAQEHGYELSGKHHEIYFGDPRRTKPNKLKTTLRHPIKKPK